MANMVSLLNPRLVSAGISVCRVNTGQIVIGVHEGKQHILLEVSDEECAKFARELAEFLVVPYTNSASESGTESCGT